MFQKITVAVPHQNGIELNMFHFVHIYHKFCEFMFKAPHTHIASWVQYKKGEKFGIKIEKNN